MADNNTQAGAAHGADDAGQQQIADVIAALGSLGGGGDADADDAIDTTFFTPISGPDSDFADVEELLGLSSLADGDADADSTGSGAGGSPSEAEGADDNTDDADAGDGGDDDVDADAAAVDTDGDAVDASADDVATEGKVDAEATKQLPKETRDQRVLRQSHQFRTSVEPVIAPVKDGLKDAVGVAVALQAGDGKAAMTAIQHWSESGARAVVATALADGAEAYVADKYGVDPSTLEAKLKGSVPVELPALLKQEVDFLSAEAQAELKGILEQARLAEDRIGAAAKSGDTKVAAVQQLLLAERTDRVQEQVDGDFERIARALKYEVGSDAFREFEERVGARLKSDPVKAAILQTFVEASTNGDKSDARRLRTQFRAALAEVAKAIHGKPVAVAAKPTVTTTAKPAVPPAPKTGAKAATATKPVSKQAIPTPQQLDAHLLKFAKDKAKELGIGWAGR